MSASCSQDKRLTNMSFEKASKIITRISWAIELMPIWALFPFIVLASLFSNELRIEALGIVFMLLFVIAMLVHLVGIALAPITQVVLAILAAKRKNTKLTTKHIILALIFAAITVFCYVIFFGRMIYAT